MQPVSESVAEKYARIFEFGSLKSNLILSIVAILLTGLVSVATIRIESAYIQNYPHFYDPASYNYSFGRLWLEVQKEGRIPVAWREATTNIRQPYRTVPTILFCPDMLAHPLGHLATAIPLLLAFLLMLGTTVKAFSRSLPVALSSMLLFSSVPILFDAQYGFAAFWLDLHAALAMGAAALSVIRYMSDGKPRWLVALALFASLTSFARYSSSFYLILLAVPILILAMAKHWLVRKSIQKTIIQPILILTGTCIPVAIYIISHYQANVHYYSTYGYAFNVPIMRSVAWTVFAMAYALGPTMLLVLTTLTLLNLVTIGGFQKNERLPALLNWCASVWCPTSAFIFLCFIVHATDGIHPTLFLVPLLFIPAFAPFERVKPMNNIGQIILVTLIVLISSTIGPKANRDNFRTACHPAKAQAQQKQVDIRLAGLLRQIHATTFGVFLSESGAMPTLEAFYCDRSYPVHTYKIFTVHEMYWKAWFPGKDADWCARQIYHDIRSLDLVAVHDNPADVLKNPRLDNVYSRATAKYIAETIKSDPSWSLMEVLPDGPTGPIGVYKNLAPMPLSKRPKLPVPYQ